MLVNMGQGDVFNSLSYVSNDIYQNITLIFKMKVYFSHSRMLKLNFTFILYFYSFHTSIVHFYVLFVLDLNPAPLALQEKPLPQVVGLERRKIVGVSKLQIKSVKD